MTPSTIWREPNSPAEAKAAAYSGSFARLAPRPTASLADERRNRKQRLAAGFRVLSNLGLAEGIAGHITMRDPEFVDTLWVNPFGMYFGHIRPSDLIRVDESGSIVEGEGSSTSQPMPSTLQFIRPVQTSLLRRTPTRSMAGPGRLWAGFSIPSPRMPACSLKTTCSSMTPGCWSRTGQRVRRSRRHSARARR